VLLKRFISWCARSLNHAAEDHVATKPSCNILGPSALGFRHRDDLREITGLLERMGIHINVVAPLGATPADLARLAKLILMWCCTPK
jgi:hypothetical protein